MVGLVTMESVVFGKEFESLDGKGRLAPLYLFSHSSTFVIPINVENGLDARVKILRGNSSISGL